MSDTEKFIIAVAIIFAIITIFYCTNVLKLPAPWERFSTKAEAGDVYKKTKPMFSGGSPSYEKYRAKVPKGDIVDYYNVKSLHLKGQLSPNNIEKVLS